MESMGGDWKGWLRIAVSCRGIKGHRAYKFSWSSQSIYVFTAHGSQGQEQLHLLRLSLSAAQSPVAGSSSSLLQLSRS